MTKNIRTANITNKLADAVIGLNSSANLLERREEFPECLAYATRFRSMSNEIVSIMFEMDYASERRSLRDAMDP